MANAQAYRDYFQYSLPTGSAEEYACQAITILEDIKSQFPQFYEIFSNPSEILTLSGVRAFDTYYDLGKDASREEIDGIKKLLRSHGVYLFEDNFPFGKLVSAENPFSLIHQAAFEDIPNRYRHLPKPGWSAVDFDQLESDMDFFMWFQTWKLNMLLEHPLSSQMQKWLLLSSATTHHIAFGILLGYPGVAICDLLETKDADYDAGLEQNARIAHAKRGAWPIYTYRAGLEDDPSIIQHERLWSDILENVYKKLC